MKYPLKIFFLVIMTISFLEGMCQNSIPKNNDERIIDLHRNGLKFEKGNVISWFPKDSLSEDRIAEIVDTLDMEIVQARKFMGAPHSWQIFGVQPITFYFSNGNFVANASVEGYVIMPFWRIRENKAPFLHEVMHVLLRSKSGNWNTAPQNETVANMPLWLTEGLPEYLAQKVAYTFRYPKFDVHKGGGYLKIDSTCSSALKTETGAFILPYVGRKGVLLELFGENRRTYAPPFYNCSCSFTKYISESYGVEALLSGISAFKEEQETIERITGKSIAAMKEEWLAQLPRR